MTLKENSCYQITGYNKDAQNFMMDLNEALHVGEKVSTQRIAHHHDAKIRTRDIHLDEQVTFSDLGLNKDLINGLSRSGFEKPSPIQLSAIPPGRCGLG